MTITFVNLTQDRVTQEEKPQMQKCFHQIVCREACREFSFFLFDVQQTTVGDATFGQLVLGCIQERAGQVWRGRQQHSLVGSISVTAQLFFRDDAV